MAVTEIKFNQENLETLLREFTNSEPMKKFEKDAQSGYWVVIKRKGLEWDISYAPCNDMTNHVATVTVMPIENKATVGCYKDKEVNLIRPLAYLIAKNTGLKTTYLTGLISDRPLI